MTDALPTIPAAEREAFLAAVKDGIAAADQGRTTPFAKVRCWLRSWGTPDEQPAPHATV